MEAEPKSSPPELNHFILPPERCKAGVRKARRAPGVPVREGGGVHRAMQGVLPSSFPPYLSLVSFFFFFFASPPSFFLLFFPLYVSTALSGPLRRPRFDAPSAGGESPGLGGAAGAGGAGEGGREGGMDGGRRRGGAGPTLLYLK